MLREMPTLCSSRLLQISMEHTKWHLRSSATAQSHQYDDRMFTRWRDHEWPQAMTTAHVVRDTGGSRRSPADADKPNDLMCGEAVQVDPRDAGHMDNVGQRGGPRM